MIEALLSLGSNVGDRKAAVDAAVRRLAELPDTTLTARSSYYRTAPVGPVAQDWFVNMAVALRTALARTDLETLCRTIETALGRNRRREVPWGPRIIDIDVVAVTGDRQADDDALANGYVIVPLAEIAPDLTVAGRTLAQHLSEANTAGVEKLSWRWPTAPVAAGR